MERFFHLLTPHDTLHIPRITTSLHRFYGIFWRFFSAILTIIVICRRASDILSSLEDVALAVFQARILPFSFHAV